MFKRWIVLSLMIASMSFAPIQTTRASDLPIAQIVKAVADLASAIALYFEEKDQKPKKEDSKEKQEQDGIQNNVSTKK